MIHRNTLYFMKIFLKFLVTPCLIFTLSGCSTGLEFFPSIQQEAPPTIKIAMRESKLERLKPIVRKDLDFFLSAGLQSPSIHYENNDTIPARSKRRIAMHALNQPWEGLTNLEKHGLLAADLAEGGAINLPGLLDVLEAGVDRTSAFHKAPEIPTKQKREELAAFMLETLEEASRQREMAVTNLNEEERRFLFDHARTMVEDFTPQISRFSVQTITRLKADMRYTELLEEQVNYANLLASAQLLGRLANEQWLKQLVNVFPGSSTVATIPSGVTGTILYSEQTSYGLILIGGTGPNTYELDHRFALVIDLGGDDHYSGMIASSTDPDHGNGVVIDLSGNDTYDGSVFGLATGRLGVGLLIDQDGNDVYQLDVGSGGAGFGGLGILFDAKGNDIYLGSRMTQGAAITGFGLLFDAGGNDRYTSHGFSIGFGGPQGMGAVIDVEGNDHYQCGSKYASPYNAEDTPNGKPGDPQFQYDCFGLGTGSGKRVLSKREDWKQYSLAGGWGLLLDIEGHDDYQSANFSLGHGYFFGIGTLMDLNGNDTYQAARYGHGSSAHFGISLFTDWQGDDRYGSTGPFYNAGVAWDHGVSLMLDSGNGNDRYDFRSSTGLGGADFSGWGIFIEEGGNDRYQAKSGFGQSSKNGIAGFFDLAGNDLYTVSGGATIPINEQPADGKVFTYQSGGLFLDR
ncbi:hypothetical protein [Petrachloros mirabilis]